MRQPAAFCQNLATCNPQLVTFNMLGEGIIKGMAETARNFVGSYTRRGHGPVWIRAELERRGISGAAGLRSTS